MTASVASVTTVLRVTLNVAERRRVFGYPPWYDTGIRIPCTSTINSLIPCSAWHAG